MIIRMVVAGVLVLVAGGLGIAFLTNRPAPVAVVEAPKPEAPAPKVAMLVAARPQAPSSRTRTSWCGRCRPGPCPKAPWSSPRR